VGHHSVLGPDPADVPFQFPKENTRKRLGCAMKYHHYVIMMLPFFLVKICENHYSPPCFPSPLFNPVYTPNQPINWPSDGLRCVWPRSNARHSFNVLPLTTAIPRFCLNGFINHPRSRSPFVHICLQTLPILETLQLFWLVGIFPVKIATD
jgi:hypothetical protein